jgi:hypothetical protein
VVYGNVPLTPRKPLPGPVLVQLNEIGPSSRLAMKSPRLWSMK